MAKELRDLECPNCLRVGVIKKISYGMPGEDFDYEKYIVGGCMPSKATIGCVSCGWTGTRKEITSKGI